MALSIVLLVICVILITIYQFSKRKFSYWKKQKVPYLDPLPILGNFRDYILLKEYQGIVEQKICQQFPNEPYVGAFYGTEPTLIVQSPDIIKLITTKDYYYFSSREVSNYTHNETFTQNMFFTYGDRWKVLRQNFTPLFTSTKMRNMFHLIVQCTHVFENLLDEEAQKKYVDIKALSARYTMDSVGACAFGIETNAMGKDIENNPFRRIGDVIFEISYTRGLSLVSRAIWPAIFYALRLKVFPTEMYTFFHKLLIGVFQARNYEPTSRNDFVDLLLNMKKQTYITGDSIVNLKDKAEGKKVSLEVDDDLLVSQCLLFFAGGFETSATTMASVLYELAKNQSAQEKAFEEVERYLQKKENHLGYDCVTDLPYLEACIDEALRLYPVSAVVTREVVENYTLPCGAVLEPGVRVHIPLYHLHRRPEYFPEPDLFRPERFLPENKQNIKPYTYLPFGEGPRICIGMRFAKMETLAGLVTVLKKYKLELAPGTPEKVTFDPRGIATHPREKLGLKITPRDGWEQRLFAKTTNTY